MTADDPMSLVGHYVDDKGGINESGEALVHTAFAVLQAASYRNSVAHGWYDDADGNLLPPEARNFGEITALFHSEITEAFDEWRNGEAFDAITYTHKSVDHGGEFRSDTREYEGKLGKPEGIATEMADAFIRMFDTAEALGIPLAEALLQKHHYNFTRPYRHGNKKA